MKIIDHAFEKMTKVGYFLHKQSQLIGMDSVSDICKYHLLSFVIIIEVKVISGH